MAAVSAAGDRSQSYSSFASFGRSESALRACGFSRSFWLLTGWVVYATESDPEPGARLGNRHRPHVGASQGSHWGFCAASIPTFARPTDRGVMYLGSSWVTMLIFLAAFGLRTVIRLVMPHRGSLSSAVGDGLLAFAIAFYRYKLRRNLPQISKRKLRAGSPRASPAGIIPACGT